jgi:DNA mismatch repair protein MutS2
VGSVVQIPEYGGQGTLLELRGKDALVQMGAVRLSLPLAKLQPLEPAKTPASSHRGSGSSRAKTKLGGELNLRGLNVEEALLAVDSYLEEAQATGISPVRLLHGKGTGALRNALREALRRDKRVESFSDAVPYEGGHGVTVVHLKV